MLATTVDTTNNTASATTQGFSYFALGASTVPVHVSHFLVE
jgi:hypothetical protein